MKNVPLTAIRDLNERFWFLDSEPTCYQVALHAKLIIETDLKFPIILSADGRVMDGMHRVCKAWLENSEAIAAVQFDEDPEPDYVDADLDTLPYDEPCSDSL